MESHEAMKLLVGGDSVAMAKRIGRKSSLIYKWCEPSTDYTDCGAYNPLDRLEAMMDEANRLGKTPLEILAPVRHLADGRALVIPIPQKEVSTEAMTVQLATVMKEIGEAVSAAAAALADNKLSQNERRKVMKELDEALHSMAALEGMFRNG